MTRHLLIAFLLVGLGECVFSQDEITTEIKEMLHRAKAVQKLAGEQKRLADRRVDVLEGGLKVRREMIDLETELNQAEQSDDEDAIERLQELLERKEISLQLGEDELELHRQFDEMLHAAQEMRLEGIDDGFKDLERALQTQRKRLGAHRELVNAIEKGASDSKLEMLEAKLEELSFEAEIVFEIFEMQRELFWMQEEGEDEEANEVRERLEQLRRQLGDGEHEDNGDPSEAKDGKPPIESDARALPISLTDEEIATISADPIAKRFTGLMTDTCLGCHDASSALGDLNLEKMLAAKPLVVNRTQWINVIEQLKNRSMPPADEQQPKEDDRKYMAAWLTGTIENFDYTTVRQAGYEGAKRLTHDEYNHTVRDLFGMDLRPADKFPDDMVASSGFDNSGNSLFIQPITMERYVGAADEIARAVFATEASRMRFFSRFGGKDQAIAEILKKFATRAFRRPLLPGELERLVAYAAQLQADGASRETAIQSTIQAILVSPSFLIRSEQTRDKESAYRVSDWELASRLSYFLWASMPDDQLVRLAARNELHQPRVLRSEVDRMLADSKSESLGELFAAQWLGYNNLNRVRPGQIDNPWCTDSLCAAMQKESGMFFHSLITDDAAIGQLIDADYTFLNEELAKHYQIQGVRGPQMRRFQLDGQPRGGILSHASVLAITSFPGRTSPVLRGNYILSELLGTPPPPPPPNASEFDERIAENERLSQREKLKRHRNNPNCYACHSQIDPLGFSLEQYDWFGRYRPRHRGKQLTGEGQFPDGTKFSGLPGLQNVILQKRMDDLVAQLTRKMTSYALGRQLEYYDEATIREIIAKVNSDDRKIRSLIHSIVDSDTFQMQQRTNAAQP